jgi:ribosomal protein L24
MHVKVGDTVEVISGTDRGVRGKILVVDHEAGHVVVEGVGRVYKHVRRSQKNPQGGRLSKEMPIEIANGLSVPGRRQQRTLCQAQRRVAGRGQSAQSEAGQEILSWTRWPPRQRPVE